MEPLSPNAHLPLVTAVIYNNKINKESHAVSRKNCRTNSLQQCSQTGLCKRDLIRSYKVHGKGSSNLWWKANTWTVVGAWFVYVKVRFLLVFEDKQRVNYAWHAQGAIPRGVVHDLIY